MTKPTYEELEALIAIKDEALKDLHYALYGNGTGSPKIEAALTATPQQVSEWEAKKLSDAEQRGAVKALAELQGLKDMYDWLWRRCKIIFFPSHDDSSGTYPIEHNPHANKDGRVFIEGKMAAELSATSKKEGRGL